MKSVSDQQIYISTVDEGSLTAAAERLGLSLAVCSKRLATLEKRLNVRLINRTTRRQNLTDEGRLYYQHCLRIQEEIDDMETSLAGMRNEVQGTLRVSTSASFGRKHVSPFISEFLQEHPQIRLQLMMSDSYADLVSDGIDVAIRIGALPDSTLIAVKLAPNRRVLCASPDYLERAGTPKQLDDLIHHQCLILSPQGASREVWLFDTRNGVKRVPVTGSVTSNSGEVVRDAALGGVGIAIKSVWDIADALNNGQLVTVLDNYALAPVDIFAVYHNRRFVSPKVKAWIAFFKNKFGPSPYWDHESSVV